METARFTYYRTESGWRMKTDEPGLEGPLEGVFRYELRLDEVPVDLPVVGHCRVLGLWCVFFRAATSTTLSGAAWSGTLSFNPPASSYTVREWTGDTTVASSVQNGKVVVNASVPAFDVRVYVLDAP